MNSERLYPFWVYQTKCYGFLKEKEIFILDEINGLYSGERGFVYQKVIFSSCVNCLKFQVVLIDHLWQIPLNCRNVYEDRNTFGSGYGEQIFVVSLPNHPMK